MSVIMKANLNQNETSLCHLGLVKDLLTAFGGEIDQKPQAVLTQEPRRFPWFRATEQCSWSGLPHLKHLQSAMPGNRPGDRAHTRMHVHAHTQTPHLPPTTHRCAQAHSTRHTQCEPLCTHMHIPSTVWLPLASSMILTAKVSGDTGKAFLSLCCPMDLGISNSYFWKLLP